MPSASDNLFKILANPISRAIFERLTREGDWTVHALTERPGVSQPMVSKHLSALKRARLIRNRHKGRETHHLARPEALAPLVDCMSSTVASGTTGLTGSKTYSKGWTNDNHYSLTCD